VGETFLESDFVKKKKKVLSRVEESGSGCSSRSSSSEDLDAGGCFLERGLISENNMAFRYTDSDLKAISIGKRKPMSSRLGNLRWS